MRAIKNDYSISRTLVKPLFRGTVPGTPYLILRFWSGFLGFQLSPKKVFQLIYKQPVSTGTASSFIYLVVFVMKKMFAVACCLAG